jgi:thiol-disulfide isomerase/thioredoxin
MPVEWLYGFETLIGVLAVLGVVLVARRFRRGGRPRGFGGWLATLAGAAGSAIGLAVLAFLMVGPHRKLAPAIAQKGRSLAGFRYQSVADGSWHSLREYRGKVVLLNIWATWCGPCRAEIPELERTQRELGGKGAIVLMVAEEEPETIREFLARHPVKTEQGYVSEAAPAAAESHRLTGIGATPLSYVVDREGVAREFLIGAGNSERFSGLVRKYL